MNHRDATSPIRSNRMTIHDYAADGDADGVRTKLEEGVLVDARNNQDFTPLACAVMKSAANIEVIDLLLANGADLHATVEEGKSFPVGLAACSGSVENLRRLVDAGADVNAASPKGYTALIKCIYRLHGSDRLAPIAKQLVEYGANLNCQTDYGESPLSVASRLGRFDIIRVLLDAGADASPLGWTTLLSIVAIGSCDDLKQLLQHSHIGDERDSFGRTPGILAATIGSLEKGQLLHSAGWGVNERGRNQESALMCCASANHSEMLSWLIDAGAELDAVDDVGNSALIQAAQSGSAKCVALLLTAGANARLVNTYSETAMSSASSVEVVRALQVAGEDIGQATTAMKRELTGLSNRAFDVTAFQYDSGKNPRFGNANPESMDCPFWRGMVRSGLSAYEARSMFGDTRAMDKPVWCFSRFGCSFTELPDGLFVQIGGEHEDYYDPDFCIYNDIILHSEPGEFRMFGYPEEVFRPTDFHSATYVDGYVYIIGGLGYQGKRVFGTTPMYRVSCDTWSIQTASTSGANPGWIYEHNARLAEPKIIVVTGGKVCREQAGEEVHEENRSTYTLNLATMLWTLDD
jgi:ankyrin repeat protein